MGSAISLVSIGGLGDRAQRCSKILPEAGWRQLNDPRRLIDQALSVRAAGIVVGARRGGRTCRRAADRIAGWRGPQSRGTEVRRLAGGERWIRTFGSAQMCSVAAREGLSGSADFYPERHRAFSRRSNRQSDRRLDQLPVYAVVLAKRSWAKNERGRRTSGSSIRPKTNKAPSVASLK